MDNHYQANKYKLTDREQEMYLQSQALMQLTQAGSWSQAESLLASLAQELYPNPKDYETSDKLIIDYTFARGATEVVKQFLQIMRQQDDIFKRLNDKLEGKDVSDYSIG